MDAEVPVVEIDQLRKVYGRVVAKDRCTTGRSRAGTTGRTPELFGALPPGVPGLSAEETAEAVEAPRGSLYRHDAVAYSCAFAGLRLTDARPFTGPPDACATLPPGDYWAVTD